VAVSGAAAVVVELGTAGIEQRPGYACPCMKVTHAEVAEALACPSVRTLNDLRCRTGAGDGCMACHRRLRCYLEHAARDTPAQLS
jgi:bacterioferritin-associated ferredoxin